jgi:hypothetical protein
VLSGMSSLVNKLPLICYPYGPSNPSLCQFLYLSQDITCSEDVSSGASTFCHNPTVLHAHATHTFYHVALKKMALCFLLIVQAHYSSTLCGSSGTCPFPCF